MFVSESYDGSSKVVERVQVTGIFTSSACIHVHKDEKLSHKTETPSIDHKFNHCHMSLTAVHPRHNRSSKNGNYIFLI